jgi:hypothetical protein
MIEDQGRVTSFIRPKSILLTICNNGNSLGHLLLLMQRKAKFGLYQTLEYI